MPQYPRNEEDVVNSCVGLLFINDDPDIDRMVSCIVEFNMTNLTSITISDSSGHDNRGIMLGDYKVSKNDYGVPITRDDPSQLPEIKIEDLAF